MVFGFDTLNEISIIAAIDGIDCSAHESVLGYYGLIIWISLAIYLMIGQFVICEEYFVPILSALGDRWHMPEDVQGATLLAVGSSSPELFTAILGVIFYPHDNPGPGTNVGSAVFNMCVIVGLSAIFAPKTAKLQIIPFLRDSIAYMIGLIELYLFYKIITPKYMDIWESILLTMWWIIYVIIVYRTDLLASRCCCCVSPHVIEATVKEIQITHDYVRLNENNNISINNSDNNNNNKLPSHRPSFFKKPSVINKSLDGEHFGVQFDNRGHPITDPEYITETDNIHIAPGALNGNDLDEDLQKLLDELNRKQRQNVNKGWVVVIMPQQHAHEKLNIPISSSADHNNNNNNQLEDIDEKNINNSIPLASGNNNNKKKKKSAHAYIRRRTLMETLSHERAVAEINEKYEEYN
eukprot:432975_1